MDFKLILLVVAGLIAGTLAFGWLSSEGGGSLVHHDKLNPNPVIRAIEFPSQIMANGDAVTGSLRFADPEGDIVEARFEVIEAVSFNDFSIDLRGAAGIERGKFTFELHSSLSQEVILNVVLIDALGNRSEEGTFSFTAIGQQRGPGGS
jgi:hypothetical protein